MIQLSVFGDQFDQEIWVYLVGGEPATAFRKFPAGDCWKVFWNGSFVGSVPAINGVWKYEIGRREDGSRKFSREDVGMSRVEPLWMYTKTSTRRDSVRIKPDRIDHEENEVYFSDDGEKVPTW